MMVKQRKDMKKIYSSPKFYVVNLNTADIVCASGGTDFIGKGEGEGSHVAGARQRNNIWGDDDE